MAFEQIFVIDDEEDILEAYEQTLQLEGFSTRVFCGGAPALDAIDVDWAGVIVTDLRMPKMDGLELLQRVRDIDAEIPVVLVTAHGDVTIAVKAMREGAYDFLEKPPNPLHMLEVIGRGLKHRRLVLENRRLRQQLAGPTAPLDKILGDSAVMDKLRKTIVTLANADVDTLITGETGTGKELVAAALHRCGSRAGKRLVALNCAALPENLIESELFGHEKGAFTNAHERRIGKIEYADKGVLFLDEIESMPLSIQVKLLRVLQERSFERLGSNETIRVDIRVIAAAKDDLRAKSEEGKFRPDLYYRLNVAALNIAPLRRRMSDVPLLFKSFIRAAAIARNIEISDVPQTLLASIMHYDWPGNVRELQNEAEKYVIGLPIELPSMSEAPGGPSANSTGLGAMMDAFEKHTISSALGACEGQVGVTAQRLGIARRTLHLRMQKYELHKEDFRGPK